MPRPLAALFAAFALGSCLAACGGGEGASPPGSAPEASDPPTPGFHDSSGSTDVPAFGVEAPDPEREQVRVVLDSYLGAVRRGERERACEHLSGEVVAPLLRLAASRTGQKGCGEGLRLALRLLSEKAPVAPYLGPARVSALRVSAGTRAGFALLHGADGDDYWAPVKALRGRWKVLSIALQPLNPTRQATR